ncbi:hypothetical protein [Bacillus altitudinis]|uniref:hypothetical protein n=1 Tax=Bacillus altitudinis TaxID=293387 RepID=UPI002100E631|nr:hypothetical protein [Bacillus altitudinis]UTV34889.1 hypothetical protein NM966_19585 [Bacillus altitudinis]
MTESFITIEKGKTPRKGLRLPTLHFIVADDWIDKLGEKSFTLWLRLLTKVDRTDDRKDTVKYSQHALAKALGMSYTKLLRLLQPLYEYGLIDYIEYKASEKAPACENVVVFEYPQNNPDLDKEPLELCRKWENRTDEKYSFTKKGGRPKKDKEDTPVIPDDILPEVEELSPESAPAPTLSAVVPDVVKSEFEHFKAGMEGNGVDLTVVTSWVHNNLATIGQNEMCFVFQKLATYPEQIRKTAVFIEGALEKASSFHRPVTAPKEEVYERKVPFYNWLEEN